MTTGPGSQPPDEEARWREIVENYGDRPQVDMPAPEPPAPAPTHSDDEPLLDRSGEGHFIPPEPPAVGWPTGPRAVACIGLFGGPTLILMMLLFQVTVPTWLGWLALLGFIAGFGYLVAGIRPRDEWDDGSQV